PGGHRLPRAGAARAGDRDRRRLRGAERGTQRWKGRWNRMTNVAVHNDSTAERAAELAVLVTELQSAGLRVEVTTETRTGGAGPSDSGMIWIEGGPGTAPTAAARGRAVCTGAGGRRGGDLPRRRPAGRRVAHEPAAVLRPGDRGRRSVLADPAAAPRLGGQP